MESNADINFKNRTSLRKESVANHLVQEWELGKQNKTKQKVNLHIGKYWLLSIVRTAGKDVIKAQGEPSPHWWRRINTTLVAKKRLVKKKKTLKISPHPTQTNLSNIRAFGLCRPSDDPGHCQASFTGICKISWVHLLCQSFYVLKDSHLYLLRKAQ